MLESTGADGSLNMMAKGKDTVGKHAVSGLESWRAGYVVQCLSLR